MDHQPLLHRLQVVAKKVSTSHNYNEAFISIDIFDDDQLFHLSQKINRIDRELLFDLLELQTERRKSLTSQRTRIND